MAQYPDEWFAARNRVKNRRNRWSRRLPVTDEELSQVEALLNDPDILERVIEVAHTLLDVVGEEDYVKAAFLAVVSCLQKPPTRPVSLLVKGEFGSGKSYVAKQVLKLFPEEAWYGFSGASSKALLYLDESFSHRMLFIPEASQLQSEGEHGFFGLMLRTLLTEGHISYPVTEAAEDGQGHVARVLCIDGPTGLILGTTAESINPENESRMVEIHTDESSEQTRAILQHRAQSFNAPAERALAELESARRIWWGVYRGLAEQGTRNVLIPFLGEVLNTIEYAPTRFRRDLGEMLPSLIGASAILHQSAREERDGCVVATLSDYRVARDIISGALNAAVGLATTPMELKLLRFIYEELPEEKRTTDSRKGHRLPAQKTIAKAIGVSQRTVGRHLESLEEAGYIENLEQLPKKPARVRLGPEFQIRLIQDTPTGVLPSVEDIEEHGAPQLPEMEAQ